MTISRKKTEVLSVSLPKDLKKRVYERAKSEDKTVSEWTKEVMRSYLLRTELERLQSILGPALKKLGIKTEDDVEKFFG